MPRPQNGRIPRQV